MRKKLESLWLSVGFFTFANVLPKVVNDIIKLATLGGLLFSSVQSACEEYQKVIPRESRLMRAYRVGNPLAKGVVLAYSLFLDVLIENAGEVYIQIIMQPAFCSFGTILFFRGIFSYCVSDDKWDGILTIGQSLVSFGGGISLYRNNPRALQANMLIGSGLGFMQFLARPVEEKRRPHVEEEEYSGLPMGPLRSAGYGYFSEEV